MSISLPLDFIKENSGTDKMFPGGSDTAAKIRDRFTLVLCRGGKGGCQRHVAQAFIFKRLRGAGIQEEGKKPVPGFRGNHKLDQNLHGR